MYDITSTLGSPACSC